MGTAQAGSLGPCWSALPPCPSCHLGAWGQADTPCWPSSGFPGCCVQGLGHGTVFSKCGLGTPVKDPVGH